MKQQLKHFQLIKVTKLLIAKYEKDLRKAEIHEDARGFHVKLYENNILVDTLDIQDKSLYYAEDCAENYLEHLGSFCN